MAGTALPDWMGVYHQINQTLNNFPIYMNVKRYVNVPYKEAYKPPTVRVLFVHDKAEGYWSIMR